MALDFDNEDYDKTFELSLKFYKIREMVRNHPKKEKIMSELANLKLSTDSNIQLVDRVCEYPIEDLSFKLSLIYILIVSFIVKLYPLNYIVQELHMTLNILINFLINSNGIIFMLIQKK